MQPQRDGAMAEEHAEFELPAIFKTTNHQQHTGRSGRLFGRLSDALKPVSQPEFDRSRTVIRFEPAGGRMLEPPQQPLGSAEVKNDAIDQVNRIAQENATTRREMVTFFDKRMSRLGEVPQPAPAAPLPPAPEPQFFEPPGPVLMPQQQPQPQPLLQSEPPQPQAPPSPPPLRGQPQPPPADTGPAGLEDAAAMLLRPILKQWLSENMPKIVEKALRSEVGADIPPPGPRDNGR